MLAGVADQGNGKPVCGHVDHGQTDAGDCDESLLDDVAHDAGRRLKTNDEAVAVRSNLDDSSGRVHVPLNNVPTEPPVGRHRALQIHPPTGGEVSQGGPAQGFGLEIHCEGAVVTFDHGQTDAINSNAVADLQVVQYLPPLDRQDTRLNTLDAANFFDYAGEHRPLLLWTRSPCRGLPG